MTHCCSGGLTCDWHTAYHTYIPSNSEGNATVTGGSGFFRYSDTAKWFYALKHLGLTRCWSVNLFWHWSKGELTGSPYTSHQSFLRFCLRSTLWPLSIRECLRTQTYGISIEIWWFSISNIILLVFASSISPWYHPKHAVYQIFVGEIWWNTIQPLFKSH